MEPETTLVYKHNVSMHVLPVPYVATVIRHLEANTRINKSSDLKTDILCLSCVIVLINKCKNVFKRIPKTVQPQGFKQPIVSY